MFSPKALFTLLAALICKLSLSQHTSIKVDYHNGFNKQTDSMLTVALKLLDSAINSDGFHQQVSNADFHKKRNKGLSNEEIYSLIRNGQEEYNTVIDSIINLKLDVYPTYAGGSEVGNTDTNYITHSYEGYITANGAACYAAHLAHEYCHVLGFTHPELHFIGKQKSHSVPYIVGDIVAAILNAKCP